MQSSHMAACAIYLGLVVMQKVRFSTMHLNPVVRHIGNVPGAYTGNSSAP
jgi:hypothetical protein